MHVSKYSMWCFFGIYGVYGARTKMGLRIKPKASSLACKSCPPEGWSARPSKGQAWLSPWWCWIWDEKEVAGSSTRWCVIIRAGSEPMQCIHLKCHIYYLTKATSALKNKQVIAYQLLRPQIFQVATTGMKRLLVPGSSRGLEAGRPAKPVNPSISSG